MCCHAACLVASDHQMRTKNQTGTCLCHPENHPQASKHGDLHYEIRACRISTNLPAYACIRIQSAPNALSNTHLQAWATSEPDTTCSEHEGTGHGAEAWRGKISLEQWGNRCIMQVGCIQVYLNSHGCIGGAASPVSASRHRGLRVAPAMAVPALKSSRKPIPKAQAAQTHHEAWIQHSRVHAMICYSVILAQSNN